MHVRPVQLGGLRRAALSPLADTENLPCDRCAGRSLGICAAFGNEALASLVETGGQRLWERRQLLYRGDDPAEAFYKIKKGIVIEYKVLTDGRRQIVTIRSVGDLCGYPAREGRYDLTAQAITPVEACAFGTAKFEARLERDIEFSCAVADDLAEQLKQACVGLTAIGQLTAVERVVHFIFQMEELQRAHRGEIGNINLHLARYEIADYLGLTVETVSRMVGKLKEEGLLTLVGRNGVSILDRERLLQVAKLGRRN